MKLEKKQAIENADTQGVAQENFPNLVNESQGTRDIGDSSFTPKNMPVGPTGILFSKQKNVEVINKLIQRTNRVLIKVSSVFPFDFFPNDITVDENKVNVILRQFFFSKRVHSVVLDDITDVFVETGPLFATVKFIDKNFVENEIAVGFLKKAEAFRVRRIVQGLMLATQTRD